MARRPACLINPRRTAVLIFLLLAACARPGPAAPAVPPLMAVQPAAATIGPPAAVLATVAPSRTPDPTATATPTAVPPTATPSATPTATPLPLLTLGVPQRWRAVVETAVAAAVAAGEPWRWQIGPPGAGEVMLDASDAGLVVAQEPLALAVPFTSDWEEVTLAQAETIRAAGHELVQVRPWGELDGRQRALRIDGLGPAGAGYPLQVTWSLLPEPEHEAAAQALRPFLQAAWPPPPLHLLAVGDIMLDRSLGWALERGELDYPFTYVAPALRAADLTVGNVESALGDTGEPAAKRYPFRAPPAAAEALALAGFDLVSLANNHAMDYGPEALLQGIDLLHAAGVQTAGAGADAAAARAPAVLQRGGLDIAFLSYVHVPVEAIGGFDTASWTAGTAVPGLAWADPAQITADVRAARDAADLVVVLLHSGYEYQAQPSEPQREAAYAAVDAGAALVIGHHAHILQGLEWRGSGLIAYGTGNFAFDIDGDPQTALFHFWLDENGVREARVEPALVQFGGQPRLAEPWLAEPIRQQVYALTKGLELAAE